jgi:hypothetical protein
MAATNPEQEALAMTDPQFPAAPLPTQKTVNRRTNVFFQLWRFAALNLRMMSMVLKGKH